MLAPVFCGDSVLSYGYPRHVTKVEVTSKESGQNGDLTVQMFFCLKNSIFFVKEVLRSGNHTGSTDWCIVFQIVVSEGYRLHVLSLAHECLRSGHDDITKAVFR